MPPLQGYPKGKLHSPLFHKHMKESAETPRAELYHWYILFYLIIHIYSHPLVQYYHFCIVDGYRYFDWEESCFRWMIVCLLGVSRLDANLSTKRWFFSHFYFLSWFVFPTQLSSIYFSDNIKCFFFFCSGVQIEIMILHLYSSASFFTWPFQLDGLQMGLFRSFDVRCCLS